MTSDKDSSDDYCIHHPRRDDASINLADLRIELPHGEIFDHEFVEKIEQHLTQQQQRFMREALELKYSNFSQYQAKVDLSLMRVELSSPVEPKGEIKIERPPGHRATVFLRVFLPKSVFDRLYGQMIADSQQEYIEALADGDEAEAKKIKRYLNYNLVTSVVTYITGLPFHLVSKAFKLFDKSE